MSFFQSYCFFGQKRFPFTRSLDDDIEEFDRFTGDYIESINATSEHLLKMESIARWVFRNNKGSIPTAIGHCCKCRCFTIIATDMDKAWLFEELKTIHSAAEEIHDEIKSVFIDPEWRRKGIGGSNMVFAAPTREKRENHEGILPGSN